MITVNTTGDADGADGGTTLSLRQAIEVSNGTLAVASLTASQAAQVSGALSTPNTIDFNIPNTGPFVISLGSGLPTITSSVLIDGYLQPGASPNTNGPGLADNAKLLIEIDGSTLKNGSPYGLDLQATGVTVQGLALGGFVPNAIQIDGPGGDLIQGDFIGTDTTGTALRPDFSYGVKANGPNNTIGGTTPAARDLISDNRYDVGLFGSGNLLEGNFIGTDLTGTLPVPNTHDIDLLDGPSTIGGTAAGAGNVISDSTIGIFLQGSGDLIEGNFIGTDATGTKALPNGGFINNTMTGVGTMPVVGGIDVGGDSNTIGGTAAGAGNVISGNINAGITLSQTTVDIYITAVTTANDNTIEGNVIGTDATGAVPCRTSALGSRSPAAITTRSGGRPPERATSSPSTPWPASASPLPAFPIPITWSTRSPETRSTTTARSGSTWATTGSRPTTRPVRPPAPTASSPIPCSPPSPPALPGP